MPRDVVGRAAALRAAELVAMAEDIRKSIRAADLTNASPDLLKQLGVRQAIILAIDTGLRREELFSLRWSQIDLDRDRPGDAPGGDRDRQGAKGF
jgi:integrase